MSSVTFILVSVTLFYVKGHQNDGGISLLLPPLIPLLSEKFLFTFFPRKRFPRKKIFSQKVFLRKKIFLRKFSQKSLFAEKFFFLEKCFLSEQICFFSESVGRGWGERVHKDPNKGWRTFWTRDCFFEVEVFKMKIFSEIVD